MLDIKFVRENPEAVKENIRKKFQNAKLPLVDEAIARDADRRSNRKTNELPLCQVEHDLRLDTIQVLRDRYKRHWEPPFQA